MVLFGAVFGSTDDETEKSCLIMKKRDTFGGNMYCKEIEGITVAGIWSPYFFHTSAKKGLELCKPI